MSINERITQTLKAKGLNQKALAAAIGVSASTLNNWIKLNRSIPSEYVIPICEYLEVDMIWLLAGDEHKKIKVQANKNPDRDIGVLKEDEKVLIQNYRDLPDKGKNEIYGSAARMAVNVENKKLLTSPRYEEDSEFGSRVLADIG